MLTFTPRPFGRMAGGEGPVPANWKTAPRRKESDKMLIIDGSWDRETEVLIVGYGAAGAAAAPPAF